MPSRATTKASWTTDSLKRPPTIVGSSALPSIIVENEEADALQRKHPVGPLLRLQSKQVRLQVPLQTPPGPRNRHPGRRARRLPQGRLGCGDSGGHGAARRPRRRPGLRRRRLHGSYRVPPERERPPHRDAKRRPMHLPGLAGRLRSAHRPRGHPGAVPEAGAAETGRQLSALS